MELHRLIRLGTRQRSQKHTALKRKDEHSNNNSQDLNIIRTPTRRPTTIEVQQLYRTAIFYTLNTNTVQVQSKSLNTEVKLWQWKLKSY